MNEEPKKKICQPSETVEVHLSSVRFFARQTSGNSMLSIFTQSCSSCVRAVASLARTEAQRFSSANAALSADTCDKQEDKNNSTSGQTSCWLQVAWYRKNILVEAIGNASEVLAIPQPAPVRDGAPNETANRSAGRKANSRIATTSWLKLLVMNRAPWPVTAAFADSIVVPAGLALHRSLNQLQCRTRSHRHPQS